MNETQSSVGAPGYSDLVERAKASKTLILAEASKAEEVRHMTDLCYAKLHKDGFFHMMTPQILGGSELSWSDGLAVAESLAQIDGSTGWCLMVAGVIHGSCGSLLVEKGKDKIFSPGTAINIAGQGIPRGTASRVDDGYLIKGEWSYGSGIYHSNWIHSGCAVLENGKPVLDADGKPEVIIVYTPRESIELLDNWNVLGLRGTGSFDYRILDEVFVPKETTYRYNKTDVERGGFHFSLGIVGFTAWGHTAFALGTGRNALDQLRIIASEKVGPFGVLGDSESFQEKYARAEAKYRATRALVYKVWNDIDETMLKGRPPTNEEIALIKLSFHYTHEVMSEICTFSYNYGGGIALRPSPLQRCYRDMHAAIQHVLLSDQIMQDCGKVLLGRAPTGIKMQLLGFH